VVAANPPRWEGLLIPPVGTKEFFGADDFQQFIRRELIPLVDGKYATVEGSRTYFGHSGGGGFGLYTMLTQPDMFKNYIISSPGLIYHGDVTGGTKRYENYDFALQEVRAFIASGKSLPEVQLYLSVGTEEEFEPAIANFQLTSSFYRMAALLRAAAIPGLKLMTEVFAGETHQTAWPIAFIHGIQAVFGQRQVLQVYQNRSR